METAYGLIVSVARTIEPLHEAEMTAMVVTFGRLVVTVPDTELAPPAIDTDVGTVASGLSELIATLTPREGATSFAKTVNVEGLPPVTVLGFKVMLVSRNGLSWRVVVVAATMSPTTRVLIGTLVMLVTGDVPIGKFSTV